MSQYLYILTWLRDVCMYESLVIGRSFKIESCTSYRTSFLKILPIVKGSMKNTIQQYKDSTCTQWEHGQIGTPWDIQRGSSFRNFSRYSRGVWIAKEGNILVFPLPLMSKGESDLVLLPSSPKGEIISIMMNLLYLMATNL